MIYPRIHSRNYVPYDHVSPVFALSPGLERTIFTSSAAVGPEVVESGLAGCWCYTCGTSLRLGPGEETVYMLVVERSYTIKPEPSD